MKLPKNWATCMDCSLYSKILPNRAATIVKLLQHNTGFYVTKTAIHENLMEISQSIFTRNLSQLNFEIKLSTKLAKIYHLLMFH